MYSVVFKIPLHLDIYATLTTTLLIGLKNTAGPVSLNSSAYWVNFILTEKKCMYVCVYERIRKG